MDPFTFSNFQSRWISLSEAKRILNRNRNAYSDEEVEKILGYLYVLAELEPNCTNTKELKRLFLAYIGANEMFTRLEESRYNVASEPRLLFIEELEKTPQP